MPTELRMLALGVIAVIGVPLVVGAGIDPGLTRLAFVALVVAAAGLLPATVPMINGLAVVIAGAGISAVAAASGSVGFVALLVAPLAVTSLRIGWRPAVWSAALGLLGAISLRPGVFSQPFVAAGLVTWLMLVTGVAWVLVFMWTARQTFEAAAVVTHLDTHMTATKS